LKIPVPTEINDAKERKEYEKELGKYIIVVVVFLIDDICS
jgi:hypothetical protein